MENSIGWVNVNPKKTWRNIMEQLERIHKKTKSHSKLNFVQKVVHVIIWNQDFRYLGDKPKLSKFVSKNAILDFKNGYSVRAKNGYFQRQEFNINGVFKNYYLYTNDIGESLEFNTLNQLKIFLDKEVKTYG